MTDKTMNPDYQRAVSEFVSRNVVCCVSTLVATISAGYGCFEGDDVRRNPRVRELDDLCERALELASPVPDYSEGAWQAGWRPFKDQFGVNCWRDEKDDSTWAGTAEDLCSEFDIEPYNREVFEHWAVSEWFADRLEERGERVDRDFAGLIVWARTTTGQAISLDGVVTEIYDAWQKELARMISGVGPAETVVA